MHHSTAPNRVQNGTSAVPGVGHCQQMATVVSVSHRTVKILNKHAEDIGK